MRSGANGLRSRTPGLAGALALFLVAGCAVAVADTTAPERRSVYFESGESFPAESDDYFELGRVAQLLADDEDLRVLVVGHTDSVGSRASNRELAFQRAAMVLELLCGAVPGARQQATVAFHAAGDSEGGDTTADTRARNRRVEMYFYYREDGEGTQRERARLQTAPSSSAPTRGRRSNASASVPR